MQGLIKCFIGKDAILLNLLFNPPMTLQFLQIESIFKARSLFVVVIYLFGYALHILFKLCQGMYSILRITEVMSDVNL